MCIYSVLVVHMLSFDMCCRGHILVRVRTIKALFGSDSYKSTNFGSDEDNAIWFTLLPGAKTGTRWGRHFGKIQHSDHPVR